MEQGDTPNLPQRVRTRIRRTRRARTSPLGTKTWVLPGGRIPVGSTGREPEYVSHDMLCVLNTSASDVLLEITLYYEDRDPVGPYRLTVSGRRTRHVRINDLIDPHAPPLGVAYACVVEASGPVVVQAIHQDTSRGQQALFSTMAYPADG
jgi:hypothetical protein